MDLKTRGRKLVLQYVNGSPCGDSKAISETSDLGPYGDKEYMDGETDAARIEEEKNRSIEEIEAASEDGQVRRKSTIISFICDREPASTGMSIVFVGTDPDECAYFFEARSSHACASAEPHKPGSVGPGSIFGLILIIAVLVYFLGGVFFNRTVNHARGWRQLPNYTLWAGMWSFFSVRDYYSPLKSQLP
jgi:cation-dependent mannose-6-phosphate receptor